MAQTPKIIRAEVKRKNYCETADPLGQVEGIDVAVFKTAEVNLASAEKTSFRLQEMKE